jgi:hypothetical protein
MIINLGKATTETKGPIGFLVQDTFLEKGNTNRARVY